VAVLPAIGVQNCDFWKAMIFGSGEMEWLPITYEVEPQELAIQCDQSTNEHLLVILRFDFRRRLISYSFIWVVALTLVVISYFVFPLVSFAGVSTFAVTVGLAMSRDRRISINREMKTLSISWRCLGILFLRRHFQLSSSSKLVLQKKRDADRASVIDLYLRGSNERLFFLIRILDCNDEAAMRFARQFQDLVSV
jgi:hypothetical protein